MSVESRELFNNAKEIPLCEWQRRVQTYCRTISGRYLPLRDPIAREYVCSTAALLRLPTFLVRFTSRDGSRLVPHDDPEATPITIAEFAKNPSFVGELLRNWDRSRRVFSAQLLVQHCSSCDHRAVIDGVHRLIHLVSVGMLDADLYVTELSSPQWPPNMPDMKVICGCKDKQG
jgi:hypothetical protein